MNSPTSIALDDRNTNSLWGSVLVETLHRLGLRQAVISPGSRSTPLTLALARHPGVESIPLLDERSAAFFALGLARRSRCPVLLLCTSGTAGANYFPAIIEAQESGVPLLVITADRPPEMRDCSSGQTIDQQKLFGSHVNFYHELAVPVASLAMLRYLRQTTAQAWERTRWPFAGPVHLNAPFRDPLPPIADGTVAALRGALKEKRFFAALKAEHSDLNLPANSRPAAAALRAMRSARGIIVVGQAQPANPAAHAAVIGRLSSALGWPVLADALSPLRNYQRMLPHLVTTYDLVPRAAGWARLLQPERVLCIDGWPTSKQLRGWLESTDAEMFLLNPRPQNADALHGRTRPLRFSVEALAAVAKPAARPGAWLPLWARVEKKLAGELQRGLARATGFFEGGISRILPGVLPKQTPIFVANSMPVRDAEYFWPANDRGHELFFNRGANGIDGTLSTALGVAHGAGRPAVLLTGDLALLHDTNGFLLGSKFKGSLTIVLINNNGGGIFEHLPVAQFNPPFEEFFATPQNVDFKQLCATYRVKHIRVRDRKHLAGLVSKLPGRGIRVLEVRTDRKRDAAFRKKLFAEVAQAGEKALG